MISNRSMSEEVAVVRQGMEMSFGRVPGTLTDEGRLKGATSQIVLLLRERHCNESKNELLHAKDSCLISDRGGAGVARDAR